MKRLLAVGLAGAIATAILYPVDPDRVAAAMCAAWWLGLTIALGALGAVLTLNVAHATWFVVFRPITSSIAAAMPLLALGLLPAALVAHRVYPWAMHSAHGWMSPAPVVVRTLISLGIWSTLALWLHATSTSSRARVLSAVGLPILAITGTVTPFDWMMGVESGFTSTIYGMYVLVGGFYGATAAVAIAAPRPLRGELRPDHIHAHGRLMLTAVCLWAYLGFFQLMLQWIGDLPHEVGFYVHRGSGAWATVSWLLVIGHFVVPFFLLLSRPLKRSAFGLAAVGWLMLAMHVVDVGWLILPSRTAAPFWSAIAPFAAVLGLGGAWCRSRFARLTPTATRDPDFSCGARYESP